MRRVVPWVALLLAVSVRAGEVRAYRTRLGAQDGALAGECCDLVVVLGEGRQVEFARADGYLPRWRTPSGVQPVADLFAGEPRDGDANCSYVQVLESKPDEVTVHWRHFHGLDALARANEALDPLNPLGITGAIHEWFKIRSDGTVEREVRDAAGTRYQDWVDPRLVTRQSLKLTATGIEHGPVRRGAKPPFFPRAAFRGNPVRKLAGLPEPVRWWAFDDGMVPHEDSVREAVSGERCEVHGLMTLYKKGVSGTALAFDGYYGGVECGRGPGIRDVFTAEAWVALDAFPYHTVPLVHQSRDCGKEGWYLGLDAYGHPLVTVQGRTVVADGTMLPLHRWAQVCAVVGRGKIRLFVDGEERAAGEWRETGKVPVAPLWIGRNNEPQRCTDTVRGPKKNLPFLSGVQGLIDEVRIYQEELSAEQVKQSWRALRPEDLASDLATGVLPGQTDVGTGFGAVRVTLPFNEVWDQLWRDMPGADIVVRFDRNPCRVIYWRGTNHAANWVTDNNRWMADQSSEAGGPHGCSEHMADKQVRHCRAEIIENTPARVVIHWRYPCVDVSYTNLNPRAWSDEYHVIYPDGTGVRKVVWNAGSGGGPGFQDIQFLTNPGESALDVMDLQAMSLANLRGETRDLAWAPPNRVPENTLPDARVEVFHSKSRHKVFAMFQGGEISPWGAGEQSKYLADPFAGPWNHWPMALAPSDGRFAVADDRVTHFALGANNAAQKFGSMVLYGFTVEPITALLPLARSWIQPPAAVALGGGEVTGYRKETRAYELVARAETLAMRVDASAERPLVNPCFTIRNWGRGGAAVAEVKGAVAKDARQGVVIDTDGTRVMVLWLELAAEAPVELSIRGAMGDG